MGVKLVSASGGSVEINPPATASNFVATMPAGTGTVSVNGVSSNIVSGTSQASTSGTSIDFTGIPSWVKRITVMFNGVSTNGTSGLLIQIGSGSFTTSGYLSSTGIIQTNGVTGATSATTGFIVMGFGANTDAISAALTLTNITGNVWVYAGNSYRTGTNAGSGFSSASALTLSSTLDRVRITTVNGTDTFDLGSINILYE